MARVLVVEDDQATGREIVAELQQHGFEAEWVQDGRDGLTIVTAMRNAGQDTPVLMISALSDVDERVRGLRAGGDDYLTKPFEFVELTARVEVLVRRHALPAPQTVLRVGDLEVDLLRREVRRAGRRVELLPREYRLLEYLMRHPGQVVTRTRLFEEVWNYHYDERTNVIDVHVGKLRRKLDEGGLPSMIHTARGSGYILRAPE